MMEQAHEGAVIEPRRGSREEPGAPVAIMACAEADRRGLCRRAAATTGRARQVCNARFLEVTHEGRILTVAGPILGAPQAVLVLEKLIALGSRTIIVLGWCGSLQACLRIGDWLMPTGARSEEGTSAHYPTAAADFAPDADLCARLEAFCERRGHPLQAGPVWSTDAPFRETAAKVRSYAAEGLMAVEMEMSALFRVAVYREVRLTGLLVVSDELFTLKWRPGFRSTRFRNSRRRAAALLLDFCASLPPDLLA
jgi:uridine phosphorylase